MSLNKLAAEVRKQGRNGDTELVHMTRGEVAGLNALAKRVYGKELPRNPETGLPEANLLKAMLPTILGAAATVMTGGAAAGLMAGAAAGALTNRENPLMGAAMGAMGGYGGGQLASGLMSAGAGAAANAAGTTALPTAATSAAPQAGMSMAAPSAGTASALPSAAANAVPQAGMSVATAQTPQAMIQGADAAGRAGYAMEGFKSLGSMDGINGFIGTAAQPGANGAAGTAATGMGGGYNAMMAAGRAAAPALMAPPSVSSGEEEPGETPKYRYDRNYTGGRRLEGSGYTSQRDWFDDSFTKLADGGAVPPPQYDPEQSPTVRLPPPPARQFLAAPAQGGPGTRSDGMSGMSKQAFEYLMGRGAPMGPVAAPVAPMQDVPAMRVTPPTGGLPSLFDGSMQRGGDLYAYRPQMPILSSVPADRLSMRRPQRAGSMATLAEGGEVGLESGGFVIPADVVAAAGAGSSNAGMEVLAKRLGARPIQGAGDGQSDSIPANIDGTHKARVARDEMMLTRQQVEQIGGGDGSKGAKKLYAMMDRIRKQATGHTKQMRPVKLDKAIK